MNNKPTKDDKKWISKKKKFGCDCKTYNEHCQKELEKYLKTKIKYTCETCLRSAYEAISNSRNAYVSDDELIQSSNGIIRHL